MSRHYLAVVVIVGLIGLVSWFYFSARMRDHQNDTVVEKPPAAGAGADVKILRTPAEVESPKAEAVEEFVEDPPVPLADGRVQTRVTIEAEKKQYFIGEEIYINHVLENVGKVSFEYDKGGDYRGATRHLRYYVEAVHEDGTEMPDPDPNQMCFGGLSSTMKLAPGQKDTERLDLLAYRRLDRPGKYRISAEEGSVPATIELVVPTPEQAKKLVEELLAKGDPDGINERGEIRAFGRLNHPIYLSIMTELAKSGSSSALLALGQTPDPQATKTIIELLDLLSTPTPARNHRPAFRLGPRLPHPSSHGHHRATARPASTMSPHSNAITPAHRTR